MPKVEKNEINLKKCICANCPTFNDCAREKSELLFCADALEKRMCQYKMRGCICPVCIVHKENNLHASFYCIQGSGEEIG